METDRLRRMGYERYRAARLETSPWQDYLIAAQLATQATAWRLAESESEGTGYRNDHTRGYWPDGDSPDAIIDARIQETKGWKRRQLRYSRIVRYLFPMIDAKLEGFHHAVLWDGLMGCLAETAAWWVDLYGEEMTERDLQSDYRLPPPEIMSTVPDGLGHVNERGLALSRGDPPVVLG